MLVIVVVTWGTKVYNNMSTKFSDNSNASYAPFHIFKRSTVCTFYNVSLLTPSYFPDQSTVTAPCTCPHITPDLSTVTSPYPSPHITPQILPPAQVPTLPQTKVQLLPTAQVPILPQA